MCNTYIHTCSELAFTTFFTDFAIFRIDWRSGGDNEKYAEEGELAAFGIYLQYVSSHALWCKVIWWRSCIKYEIQIYSFREWCQVCKCAGCRCQRVKRVSDAGSRSPTTRLKIRQKIWKRATKLRGWLAAPKKGRRSIQTHSFFSEGQADWSSENAAAKNALAHRPN